MDANTPAVMIGRAPRQITGWAVPELVVMALGARALGQVVACLAYRQARPAGRGAAVGDGREQRVLPEVVGLPPAGLLQQVRFGPALEGCRGQHRVLELRVLPAAEGALGQEPLA